MVYKQIKIKEETNEKLDMCIIEFLRHNRSMRYMRISRNKIINEMADFYLK